MKSWKTSVGGIMALLGAAVTAAPDNAPGAEYIKPWASTLVALGAGIVGLAARDNKVSSEDVGAKEI